MAGLIALIVAVVVMVLDAMALGETLPTPSPIGRWESCPEGGPTTLKEMVSANHDYRQEQV